jgi:hypothetical protein
MGALRRVTARKLLFLLLLSGLFSAGVAADRTKQQYPGYLQTFGPNRHPPLPSC